MIKRTRIPAATLPFLITAVCALVIACPASASAVPQDGARADYIRNILTAIELPPGFHIALYAVAPGARHMAVDPLTGTLFVGTRGNDVWVVSDKDGDDVADEVTAFAPELRFRLPNGPCFAPDGTLYIAELNKLRAFPQAGRRFTRPQAAAAVVIQPLVPPGEQSYNHGARVCRVGPDDRLYIALGQPWNVAPREKLALYDEVGIGGIIRVDRDGANREVYARGIRNSVGMDFHPLSGELWFTDNQVDGMGDDVPPGELNRSTAPGGHYGFPWYGGGGVRTREYRDDEPPPGVLFPEVEMVAHAADLGMVFYTGRAFPAAWRGGVFNAQHGSWDRTTPVGARVMFTAVDAAGRVGETTVFASGWLDEYSGRYRGRPVDVALLHDGSLLVSDDHAGAVYRIRYAP